jgi:hypothetical protein
VRFVKDTRSLPERIEAIIYGFILAGMACGFLLGIAAAQACGAFKVQP